MILVAYVPYLQPMADTVPHAVWLFLSAQLLICRAENSSINDTPATTQTRYVTKMSACKQEVSANVRQLCEVIVRGFDPQTWGL